MMATRIRSLGELALPGACIGTVAGVAAGGLAAIAGQPAAWAAIAGLTLALPLALLGGGFGLLLGAGVIRPGVFAPAGLYWLVGFPTARLVHEVLAGLLLAGRPALPADLVGFLAYQALVSMGFAIGFSWLHERFAPLWLRRVSGHNPQAQHIYHVYLRHAEAAWRAREGRRRARAAARGLVRSRPEGES